jgi:hypothetical protein
MKEMQRMDQTSFNQMMGMFKTMAGEADKVEESSFILNQEQLVIDSLAALEGCAHKFDMSALITDAVKATITTMLMEDDPPTSQARYDEVVAEAGGAPNAKFLASMLRHMENPDAPDTDSDADSSEETAPFSITAEEFADAMFASMQKRANELSISCPDDDWVLIKSHCLTSAGDGLPESQEECDEIFGEMTGADKDDLEHILAMILHQIKQASTQGGGAETNVEVMVTSDGIMYKETPKEDDATTKEGAWSITKEEMVENSLRALSARAKEFGTPLSDEDSAVARSFMATSDVDMPKSKQEHDDKMKEMQRMDQTSFNQMMGMFKVMAGN